MSRKKRGRRDSRRRKPQIKPGPYGTNSWRGRIVRLPTRGSDLTAKEQDNVRAALRFLKARCGMWATLAKLLHCDRKTLYRVVGGGDTVVASLAIRVAKFANVPVDDVLAGRFPPPGTCPQCGHRTQAAG